MEICKAKEQAAILQESLSQQPRYSLYQNVATLETFSRLLRTTAQFLKYSTYESIVTFILISLFMYRVRHKGPGFCWEGTISMV